MVDLAIDGGNYAIKITNPSTSEYLTFRHALTEIPCQVWDAALNSSVLNNQYAKINGIPYAFGDAAMAYQLIRPEGAARYTELYYGTLYAYSVALALKKSPSNLRVVLLHAPRDHMYVNELKRIAQSNFTVQFADGDLLQITASSVKTIQEPLGGFINAGFNENGTPYTKNPVSGKRVLVVDIGGLTTDIVKIDSAGNIDINSMYSIQLGMNGVLVNFEDKLKTEYYKQLQYSGALGTDVLASALIDGMLPLGKLKLDCKQLAHNALMPLINSVIDAIRQRGEFVANDVVLLSGGGGALAEPHLKIAMSHGSFLLADKPKSVQFANVKGAAKLFKMSGISW